MRHLGLAGRAGKHGGKSAAGDSFSYHGLSCCAFLLLAQT
jgi:hypothetical protein